MINCILLSGERIGGPEISAKDRRHGNSLDTVAYLGFHKGEGKFSMATSAYLHEGETMFSNFFPMTKTDFFGQRRHGPSPLTRDRTGLSLSAGESGSRDRTLHYISSFQTPLTPKVAMQWCINKYMLYEIQPTGPACKLAT